MIALLNGKIVSKTSTHAVIDCSGVGFLVNISVNTSEKLSDVGEAVSLYTLLIPKEDSLNLYGFWDESEREAFTMLISISGIGPKISLGILSSITIDSMQEYIISGNIAALSKLPGIGKKTAERIIIELRDKIGSLIPGGAEPVSDNRSMLKQEAISALVTLGYSRLVAEKAVAKVINDDYSDINAEKLIKLALRNAMK